MLINEKMSVAISGQINEEFYSSYLYLSMSAYCESVDLPGFAYWLRVQSQEEYMHAMNLFDYMQRRQGIVHLYPIAQPPLEFDSVLDVMQQILKNEQSVSHLICELYELACQEKDYPTQVHMQAFITEQVEEEKSVADVIAQLQMIGDSTSDLLILDREMATRQAAQALPTPAVL